MGTNAGRVQGAGSGRRVPVNVDLAELDNLIAETSPRIIAADGFTQRDIRERHGWNEKRARLWIEARIADGTVKEIGIRPGHGGPKVYGLVDVKKPMVIGGAARSGE